MDKVQKVNNCTNQREINKQILMTDNETKILQCIGYEINDFSKSVCSI
jgi:hypothetical protein